MFQKHIFSISTNLTVLLFVAFTLSACSNNNNGGGTPPPLRPFGSTDKVVEVAQNFNRIQKVATKNQLQTNTSNTTMVSMSTPTTSDNLDMMMSSALQSCNIEMNAPKVNEKNPMNFSYQMKIQGSTCPIQADYSMSSEMTMDNSSFSQNFKAALKILDATLAEKNDVFAADLAGSVKGTQLGEKGAALFKGTTKGTISSKKYGQVLVEGVIEGSADSQSSHTLSRLTITVQEERTELLKQEDSKDGKTTVTTFSINGKLVKEDEYNALYTKLGLLTQGMSLDNEAGKPTDSMENNNPTPPIDVQPPPPFYPSEPPPPAQDGERDGGDHYQDIQCHRKVSELKPHWTNQEILRVCRNTDTDCVLHQLKRKPNVHPEEIIQLCRN